MSQLDMDTNEIPAEIERLRMEKIEAKDAYDAITRRINRKKAEYKVEARSKGTEPSNRDERKGYVKEKQNSETHRQLVEEQEDLRRDIEVLGSRIERLRKEFTLATAEV